MTARTRTAEPAHRRTHDPVHRGSVLAGSEADAIRRRRAPDKSAWFAVARRRLRAHAVSSGGWRRRHAAAAEIGEVLWAHRNRQTGQITPSYDRLAEITGFCRATVAEGLALLRDLDVLSWMRRFVMAKPGKGREAHYAQTSNAYWFELPVGAQALLAHRLRAAPPCEAEAGRRRELAERQRGAELEALDLGDPNAPAAAAARRRQWEARARPEPPGDESASIARMRAGLSRRCES